MFTIVSANSEVVFVDRCQRVDWSSQVAGVKAAYINYAPDLAIPGAADSIQAFVDRAKRHDVRRLVLLSGRGEAEAQACERIVQDSGAQRVPHNYQATRAQVSTRVEFT